MKYLKKMDDFLVVYLTRWNRFFTPERVIFLLLLFMLWHALFSLLFNHQIYRDVAGVYAWYAREFGGGRWWDVPISKVPCLNIFLGGLLVRCGVEAYTGMILLSLLSMMLTVFPLYRMLSLFCSARSAAYGCALWTFTPKILRFAGTGLLESTRDFFLVSACYLLFKSWNGDCKWHHWILFGLALGGLVLARGEGAVMAAFLFAGLAVRPSADFKSVKRFLENVAAPMMLSALVALAAMSPVLVQNFKVTGYPVTEARMIGVFKMLPFAESFFAPKNMEASPSGEHRGPVAAEQNAGANGNMERLRHFPGNLFRGAYELYFSLALLGIVLLLLLKKWRREYTFLVLFCVLTSACFVFFSVAYRYFVFIVPLFMVFTVQALEILLRTAKEHNAANVFSAVAAVVVLAQPFNAWCWMADSDADQSIVRKYMKENRSRFLPPGSRRKLIIHGDACLTFLCGEDRLFQYGEQIPETRHITGFDVLLVEKRDERQLADCAARRDLRPVESPFEEFAVFVPVGRMQNE